MRNPNGERDIKPAAGQALENLKPRHRDNLLDFLKKIW